MNWDYVLDIGAKGILTTIVAGVILKFIQRVYDKLKRIETQMFSKKQQHFLLVRS